MGPDIAATNILTQSVGPDNMTPKMLSQSEAERDSGRHREAQRGKGRRRKAQSGTDGAQRGTESHLLSVPPTANHHKSVVKSSKSNGNQYKSMIIPTQFC